MRSLMTHTPSLHWLGKQLFNRDDPAAYFDPLLERLNPMWVRQYTPARVEAVVTETADTKTFILRPASRWSGFEAGQHVTVGLEVEGIRRHRTFSLSSTPAHWGRSGTVTLTIKRQPGGLVTNWMHDELAVGDVLSLGNAFGDFRVPAAAEPALYIAGGSGITPILSQLETLANDQHSAPVTLLYFVRSQADIIGAERLYTLRQRWPAFTLTIVAGDGPQPVHLDDSHLAAIPELAARRCYLCGPAGLMTLAQTLLDARGVDDDRIERTFFAPPQTVAIDSQGGQVHFSKSNVRIQSTDDTALLDLAESASLSPRHGCRMGICHQCSCRKTSGTVVNRLTGQSSGAGEETIQLCISVPQGEVDIQL